MQNRPGQNDSSDDANTVIFYVMLSIGLLFAGLNIVLIVVNYRTMLRNLYARLMLLVQCCYVVLIVIDAQPPIEDLTACRFAAACFYVFWMCSTGCTLLILLLVCMDLKHHRKLFRQLHLKLLMGILALALLIGFVPFESYKQCTFGGHYMYCGGCLDTMDVMNAITALNNILPVVFGGWLFIRLYRLLRPLRDSDLTTEQKQSVSMLYMPILNLVIIVVNGLVMLVRRGIGDEPSAWDPFLIIVSQFIFLIPLLNLAFFVRFVAKLQDIADLHVRYCRCLFPGLSRTSDPDLDDELL